MITLLSFDDVEFADIDWTPIIPQSAREEWSVQNRITPRTGNSSIIGTGSISPRRVTVDFVYEGSGDIRQAVDELVGVLDPRDPNPRLLVGTRVGGATVQRYARVDIPSASDANDSLNGLRVVFVSEEPEWVETTATTETGGGSTSPFALAFDNAGEATVWPKYRLGWSAQHSANGTVIGQRYRKRMTVTNTQDRTLGPFPYRIDLGDTAALVTASKLQADGDDLRVIIDGKDQKRLLQGINKTQTFAWIVLPGMDAGEELTIDVVYGNPSATNPPVWTDPDPTKPVIDLRFETGTATGGTTGSMTVAGTPWVADQWKRGYLYMLTGTLAGEFHTIISNTTNSLVTSTFSATIDNLDTYMIVMSANNRWNYEVRQTDRETDYYRGRWYVDSPKYTPNVVSFEAPGAWRRELVWDNRDKMGQKRWSMLTTGGSDKDPFAILDTYRTWEGGSLVPEEGTSDGVALTTPCPITELFWEYQFLNKNAMCKAWIGVRGSGAEDWSEAFSDDAVYTTLTTTSTGVSPLDLSDFNDPFQIVMALGPAGPIGDVDEISLDWKQDTGSATAGTTTSITDTTKSWATTGDGQFDNAKVTMLSGANAGKTTTVTSNTSQILTITAFPTAVAAGDRYVVTNATLRSNLRDGGTLNVTLDDSVLDDGSGLGTETAVYDMSARLWIGAGPAGDEAYQHKAYIGYQNTVNVDAEDRKRRLFLTADEQVEIDAALRRIRIWDTVSESYTAELTDPAVIIHYHDGADWRRSSNWLPLGTNAQSIWLEETNIGTLSLDVIYAAAWLGA